jgi:lysozyme
MANRKSKIPLWLKNIFRLVLLLAVLFVIYENKKYIRRAYRFITHRYYKNSFKPSDFPDGFEVHGIDVSHFQDVIDWKRLMAVTTYGDTIRFNFVYIKATQGMILEDEMFEENWEDARDQHVVRGAYHYFLPDKNAGLQADNFILNVKLKPGDLPPAVDIEEARGKSKKEIIEGLKTFIQKIEEHYGVKPIIYSNLNFIEDYLSDDFKDYPFWISHFYEDELPADENIHWLFWQHSNKTDLLGINGNVDADVFNGTYGAFDSLLIK